MNQAASNHDSANPPGANQPTAGKGPPRDADLQALAHARHELRTPLNALLGYSEMLLEDAEEYPELHAGLQEIQLLSRHLQDAVSEGLHAHRLEGAPLDEVWRAARAVLAEPCANISERVQTLMNHVRTAKLATFQPDLERLQQAAARFHELLQARLSSSLDLLSQPIVAPAAAPPAVKDEAADSAEWARNAEPEPQLDEFRGHVLVVDDNKFNREILARGLLKQKRHFALAAHGKQALEMLATRAFDVVLLDIMMPEMDGFETLKRIKADPDLCHVPVIMISALDQIESVVRCIEMGAEDYLPKPFDPVLLRARVGACLEKKRLRDQELEYLRNVALVTEAASAVEAGSFDPQTLEEVAARPDSLGRLARVFQSMAREVRAREERLQRQVQELRIEIDQSRKAKQVAEITESDYFQQLQRRAQELKQRKGS